ATLLPDGTLRLNVGDSVGGAPGEGKRQIQPNEINERYVIHHVGGDPNDPAGETVRVEAFGVSQEFSGVKSILALAGAGDDQILLDSGVLAPSFLSGEGGQDTLQAGAGAATLDGGDEKDSLIGSPQIDDISGGGGDDTIDARGGDDIIYPGEGDDVV